jgi:hypothetical protein
MSNSSARQSNYSGLESGAAETLIDASIGVGSTIGSGSATTLTNSKFDDLAGIRAHAARIASRINASNVSSSEIDRLFRTRKELLDKKLNGNATRQELNRLEYIRWSLDRVEDAQVGEGIDKIEDFVTKYEDLLAQIEMFRTDLRNVTKKK